MRADIARQEEYSRFMPLVKWLLAIPHYFCLFFLGFGALFVIFISFFAVLFTGQYPRGMFDFVVGVQRWGWRVNAYTGLLVDPYPPFTLDDVSDYPARFVIDYPEQGVERWRPFVQWLLIIPFMIVAGFLAIAAFFVEIAAFFTILFTRQFPEGMFNIAVNAFRWIVRANAYRFWLIEKYPPFELEPTGDPGSV